MRAPAGSYALIFSHHSIKIIITPLLIFISYRIKNFPPLRVQTVMTVTQVTYVYGYEICMLIRMAT